MKEIIFLNLIKIIYKFIQKINKFKNYKIKNARIRTGTIKQNKQYH